MEHSRKRICPTSDTIHVIACRETKKWVDSYTILFSTHHQLNILVTFLSMNQLSNVYILIYQTMHALKILLPPFYVLVTFHTHLILPSPTSDSQRLTVVTMFNTSTNHQQS